MSQKALHSLPPTRWTPTHLHTHFTITTHRAFLPYLWLCLFLLHLSYSLLFLLFLFLLFSALKMQPLHPPKNQIQFRHLRSSRNSLSRTLAHSLSLLLSLFFSHACTCTAINILTRIITHPQAASSCALWKELITACSDHRYYSDLSMPLTHTGT